MFNAINLIISIFLSLITWLVLGYFELIEGEGSTNFEKSLEASLLDTCLNNSFDIYFNFFWIFACIYALSKVTELSERYLCAHIESKERSCDVRSINAEWERTLKMYDSDKEKLAAQIDIMREKNHNLEHMMRDLRDCNLQLINENFMRSVMHEQQIQGLAQIVQDRVECPSKVFITNRHIHLTRQVFVNQGHIDVNVRNGGGQDQQVEDRLNVWVQYLKMRKCYMGQIADPNLILGATEEPVVLTTEQLAKFQGII